MRNFLFALLAVASLVACNDDDDIGVPPANAAADSYVFFLQTDQQTGAGLAASYDSVPTGTVDPVDAPAVLQLGRVRETGSVYNGDIYNRYSTTGEQGIQKYTVDADGRLADAGFIVVEGDYNAFEVTDDDAGYYYSQALDADAIQTFDPVAMSRTGQIDLSDALAPYQTDSVAQTWLGGFMIERDGKLFTQAHFYDSNGLTVYDSSFIAVVDLATRSFEGFTIYPEYLLLGYFGLDNSRFATLAPNGDLYLAAFAGNFGDPLNSHLIRINEGTTELDANFDIDFNEFVGGPSFLFGGALVLGDRAYVRLKASEADADFGNLGEPDIYPHAVDLNTGAITRVEGIPGSAFISIEGPQLVGEEVFFVVSNEDYQGYYALDPATGATREVVEFATGVPQSLFQLE